ncbi:STAS domain-containing protein [Amycolatopsis sp. DG1A-15b]|uniref:STAS domain-containing protein n=1 Tax=Amycolatopsis sp. DG1A-15b TaxID=3052846 RepID=UPI00255B6740|nr:STAS domain-containing protein [Amycolatopsis sp. DG1A-15b]WIX91839.1 STAS domain-containing protein [Amycolatopsis sp. DG1A-15b]
MSTDAARLRQRSSGDGWSLEAHDASGVRVHTLRGEFDFAVSAKLADLLPAGPGPARIVVDMAEVGYCDSSCLQVLLRPARGLRAAGGRFAVVSAAPAVTRPIALLGLGDIMPVYPALEAAEASWGAT